MTDFRKYALFQLAVTGSAAIAVIVLYLLFHNIIASLAGFALLGLLGFRAAFVRRPVADERDEAISRRAVVTGHVALWLALVAWGVTVTLVFAESGSVPMAWVAPVVWVAAWLVTCVQSITILVLDRAS